MALSESPVSSNHLLEVDCRDIVMGMYISELDCRWSDTPFPPGGFHLKKSEDLQILNKFCKRVTIDINKGAAPPLRNKSDLTILSNARRSAPAAAEMKVNRDAHKVTASVKKEIDKANRNYINLQNQFQQAADGVREGKTLAIASLDKPIAGLIKNILANPQTLIWILNTESTPRHRTSYCVRAAIWATTLARHMGLSKAELEVLFLGTLLCDIGMHLLPERLVNKRGYIRKKEYLAYRKHVNFGLDLLSQHPELDERVHRIVRCHHERHDGNGFPRGVRGDQVPALARFANLAYSFERLLFINNPDKKTSPAKAITGLYKQRALKFPEQLVVEFINLLGTYPVGSVVELSSEDLALVLEKNEKARLFPKVAIIIDSGGTQLKKPVVVDLAAEQNSETSRTINNSAEIEALNLDLDEYTLKFWGTRLGIGPLGVRL